MNLLFYHPSIIDSRGAMNISSAGAAAREKQIILSQLSKLFMELSRKLSKSHLQMSKLLKPTLSPSPICLLFIERSEHFWAVNYRVTTHEQNVNNVGTLRNEFVLIFPSTQKVQVSR